METKIQLKDGRVILINEDLLTIRARRQAKNRFKKDEIIVEDNKAILANLENEFKITPPTQQRIFEGYLSLVKPNAPDDDKDEMFLEECCRLCCRWVNDKGEITGPVTEDEFQNLPFDAGPEILKHVFGSTDKSFLVLPPV